MYLLDTNILLELLLDQDRADEVEQFIRERANLYVSDFSFHSLGVISPKGDRKMLYFLIYLFICYLDASFISNFPQNKFLLEKFY